MLIVIAKLGACAATLGDAADYPACIESNHGQRAEAVQLLLDALQRVHVQRLHLRQAAAVWIYHIGTDLLQVDILMGLPYLAGHAGGLTLFRIQARTSNIQ